MQNLKQPPKDYKDLIITSDNNPDFVDICYTKKGSKAKHTLYKNLSYSKALEITIAIINNNTKD